MGYVTRKLLLNVWTVCSAIELDQQLGMGPEFFPLCLQQADHRDYSPTIRTYYSVRGP